MPGSRFHAKLSHRRWQAARRAALTRDNWRCQQCGRVVNIVAEVHHVTPLEDGGAAYELANLVTLCRTCHYAEHGKRPDAPGAAAWRDLVAELQDNPT